MIAFLFAFGLAALLIVGGVRGSLRLRTHRMSPGRRLSGLRRSYAAPLDDTTAARSSLAEDEMSRYTRKAWVILILILVMLSMIISNAISAFIH